MLAEREIPPLDGEGGSLSEPGGVTYAGRNVVPPPAPLRVATSPQGGGIAALLLQSVAWKPAHLLKKKRRPWAPLRIVSGD